MDGRRSYSNEPEPWFPDDDTRRGPRDPRYAEFGEVSSRHGVDGPAYPGRGFDPRDPDERDIDPRDFGRSDPPVREEFGGRGFEDDAFGGRSFEEDPLTGGFDAAGPGRRRQTRPRGKRSGLEMPLAGDALDEEHEAEPAPRFHTEALDRNALRRPEQPGDTGARGPVDATRPAGAPAPVSTVYAAPTQSLPSAPPAKVYVARRPGVAVLLGLVAAFTDVIIALRVFLASMLADGNLHQGGIMGGLFALSGVPLVAFGLYGLATGSAAAGGPQAGRAWLRTPLAYLPVGLVLLLAAGMAV